MRKAICSFFAGALVVSVLSLDSASQGGGVVPVKQQERFTLSVALEFSKKNPNIAQKVFSVLTATDPNAYATGFWVGDGLVMTAYHVVSGNLSEYKKRLLGFKAEDELQVRVFVNGCPARVVQTDKEADLALLRVCVGSTNSPRFDTTPTKDEKLYLIAKPRDNRFLRKGVFHGLYTFRGNQYWSIKIDALDGFSGSPVYNEQGEVVGIFCGYDPTVGVAFISPSVKAEQLLAQYYATNKDQP